MAAIRYNVINGWLPVTVYLMQGETEIANNVHNAFEEGQFTDVLEGEYTLLFVDDVGCSDSINIPTTTTTTTTIYCEDLLCDTTMTVGEIGGMIKGFVRTLPLGNLSPNCENIDQIVYNEENLDVYTAIPMNSPIVVAIDYIQYILPEEGTESGGTWFRLSIESDPFPATGENCNVKICATELSTTTTTSEPTTTTTTVP
jgi:hypothetical protein